MPSCVFSRCRSSKLSKKELGITYHSFPKDLSRRQKWIDVVRQQRLDPDWTASEHSTLCSIHFKKYQIHTICGTKRLTPEAVPSFQGMITDDLSFEPGCETIQHKIIKQLKAHKERLEKENKRLKRRNKMLEEKCKSIKEVLKNIVIS